MLSEPVPPNAVIALLELFTGGSLELQIRTAVPSTPITLVVAVIFNLILSFLRLPFTTALTVSS